MVRPFVVSALALLTACSAHGQGSGFLPQSQPPLGGAPAAERGNLRITVTLPRQSGKHARYVSNATQALTVDIAGPTKLKKTVGLTLGSDGCKSSLMTTQCTLDVTLKPCPTSKNCYTATVATYDAIANGTIPKTAHELSADQNYSFTIGKNTTLVPLSLYGIPKSIVLNAASQSGLTGSQKSGFVIPKCGAATQDVELYAADADGNLIVGAGAPSLSLTSSSSAQLSIVKPGASNPNTFGLALPAAPAYPYGGLKLTLTAKATPNKASGGTAITKAIIATYSGDICGIFTEFKVPTASAVPAGIAMGPDGALWFAELNVDKIGRITTTGTIKEYKITTGAHPYQIASGPDGKLWFTEIMASKIGHMATTGTFSEYPTVTANAGPTQITTGPDHNMWFMEQTGNNAAKITAGGVVTEYPLPTANALPFGITSGPDGLLWFTELDANQIGSVSTTGTVTEYPVPTAASKPATIVRGSDGALWFSECQAGGKIGRVQSDLVSTVVTSEYPTPESGSEPTFLANGPDSAVWFSETTGNRIARITTGGAFTEYSVPSTNAYPFAIVRGPDGAIWFTEELANKIGRLR